MTPESITNHEPAYPGVIVASGVKVSAAFADGSPTETYTTSYKLNAKIDLSEFEGTESTFKYTVYRTDGTVATPVSSCTEVQDTTSQAGETRFSVTGCTVSTDLTTSGTTKVTETSATTDSDGITTISIPNETLEVGSDAYYYIVVNYENAESDQAGTDAGKAIKIEFTSITDAKVTASAD